MDYAIVTDPDRPHYGECGPVEQVRCFYCITWKKGDPTSLEAYFREEIHLFSVNSPSIGSSPMTFSAPDEVTTLN